MRVMAPRAEATSLYAIKTGTGEWGDGAGESFRPRGTCGGRGERRGREVTGFIELHHNCLEPWPQWGEDRRASRSRTPKPIARSREDGPFVPCSALEVRGRVVHPTPSVTPLGPAGSNGFSEFRVPDSCFRAGVGGRSASSRLRRYKLPIGSKKSTWVTRRVQTRQSPRSGTGRRERRERYAYARVYPHSSASPWEDRRVLVGRYSE